MEYPSAFLIWQSNKIKKLLLAWPSILCSLAFCGGTCYPDFVSLSSLGISLLSETAGLILLFFLFSENLALLASHLGLTIYLATFSSPACNPAATLSAMCKALPSLVAVILRKPLSQGVFKFHVVITTFEMILADCPELKKIHWSCVIIDEAHRVEEQELQASGGPDSWLVRVGRALS